jgi:uncharacterized membrane protein YeaQ/YmgE (transglycosylase-associated protein family)
VKPVTFIPTTGILNQIFHQTRMTVQVADWPAGGYSINLIQLLILLALAVIVVYVTEKLTKSKVGGLVAGVIITVIGAYIFQSVTNKVPDISIEGIRIVSSLIGAIIISVFYTLIRAQFSKGGGK